MNTFPISFFAGESWDEADLVAQSYAIAMPREGDLIFLKNTTEGSVNYPVISVRHEFNDDEHVVKVLLSRPSSSIYETRGVRFI